MVRFRRPKSRPRAAATTSSNCRCERDNPGPRGAPTSLLRSSGAAGRSKGANFCYLLYVAALEWEALPPSESEAVYDDSGRWTHDHGAAAGHGAWCSSTGPRLRRSPRARPRTRTRPAPDHVARTHLV